MKKRAIILLIVMLSIGITGCGKQAYMEDAVVSIEDYQKETFNTVLVASGDMEPMINLKLQADKFESNSYSISQEELEVDKVLVDKGQHVKKGDVMVTFKSGDIKDKITKYQNQMDEDALMIEHYNKLMEIENNKDSTEKYTEDIKLLNADIQVASLYITELRATLQSYSLIANQNGTVANISDLLQNEKVTSDKVLITVISGSGDYYTETTDQYDFKVGDIYQAAFDVASFDMELTSIEEMEDDKDGNKVRKLVFTPISEMPGVSESELLDMNIKKPELKGVMYVPESAVRKNDDNQKFVYTVDDNGFRDVVLVETGETVDGCTIIKSGLKGGEKVVVE